MKETTDHFSRQSGLYAKFRPTYPQALYDWLFSLVPARTSAWDCGTGNGQVAVELAKVFQQVHATDISQKQLDKASPATNITYQLSRSEQSPFSDQQFDLITVGQAFHWFDHAAFFEEAARTLKPNGILAIWGYGLLRIHPEIDPLLDHYYRTIIGPYWASERKYVDDHYGTISFPLQEAVPPQPFWIEREWTLEQMEGYLNTWSSLQSYLQQHQDNPASALIDEIRQNKSWEASQTVRFPIFTKVGHLTS
ncbi:MAG: class I SAM-dependent methyltransferase [Bacteroidota bacterium]